MRGQRNKFNKGFRMNEETHSNHPLNRSFRKFRIPFIIPILFIILFVFAKRSNRFSGALDEISLTTGILILAGLFVIILLGMIGYFIYTRSKNASSPNQLPKQSLDKTLVDIAKNKNGHITLADVVEKTDLSFEKAKSKIDELAKAGVINIEFDESGNLYYTMKDIPHNQ